MENRAKRRRKKGENINKKNANYFLLITVIILIIVLAEIIIEEINGEGVVNFNAIMICLFKDGAWKKVRFLLACGCY